MTLRGRVTTLHERTGETQKDRVALQALQVAKKLNARTDVDHALITGTRQTDGSLSDGVSIPANSFVELAHNLGRPAQFFLVIDCQDFVHHLTRDAKNLTSDLKNTHIRLVNDSTAPGTCRVKLMVW